jgi:KDO2-lipid IV(A) lauroyltransferase
LHRNALREILRALTHGNIVGFVLDQHARTDAVWVPFFGRPAATLRSLAVIAQRTGAPVVPMFTWRLSDGTHVVEAQPAVETETAGDSDASALHNTARYSAVVEAAVRAHPEQWTWIHRRWKQPPAAATPMIADGTPSILMIGVAPTGGRCRRCPAQTGWSAAAPAGSSVAALDHRQSPST